MIWQTAVLKKRGKSRISFQIRDSINGNSTPKSANEASLLIFSHPTVERWKVDEIIRQIQDNRVARYCLEGRWKNFNARCHFCVGITNSRFKYPHCEVSSVRHQLKNELERTRHKLQSAFQQNCQIWQPKFEEEERKWAGKQRR
nr:hypothetical protein Iba_scaffold17015CG0020 [Ipomoea batatas]